MKKGKSSVPSRSERHKHVEVPRLSFLRLLNSWRKLLSREVNVTESTLIEADKWTQIFRLNHPRLFTTAALLSCCGCVEDILEQAEDQVKSFVVPDAFKYSVVLRTVVKICLTHVSRCNEVMAMETGVAIEYRLQRIRALPIPERFIYVLRELLRYPRRDVSLLVGVSDEVADRLLRLARRRLAQIPTADVRSSAGRPALS